MQLHPTLPVVAARNAWEAKQAPAPAPIAAADATGLPWPQVDSSLDLFPMFPTLLKLAGLEAPAGLPGIDLSDPAAVRARPALFGDCHTHNAVDLEVAAANLRWRWVLADGWKLIVADPNNQPGAPVELFHLSEDPHELNNLAPTQGERVARLRAVLDSWWNPHAGAP